jgi:serine/threonine protein kinase
MPAYGCVRRALTPGGGRGYPADQEMTSEPPKAPSPPKKRGGPDTGALIGTMIAGKYRLLRAVGHGGMGTVFKAENTAIGKIVALKLLHANLADDGVVIQRFQREARTTVTIGHPNIVEVLDMGQEPSGAPYIVMEYVRGKSLKKLLRHDGPLTTQRVARIAGMVLDALAATHKSGIVHRDLKPENILITPRYGEPDFVKVFDFGISTFTESMAEKELKIDLTPTGFTMATPFYASPEQIRGAKGRDPRVDIYAVGVIMYEMLTGHRPFDGANLPDLCTRILSGDIAPLRVFRLDVPEAFENVVRRALALRAVDRYQTAGDMLWALVPFGASPPRAEDPEPTDTFTIDLRELRAREGLINSSLPSARDDAADRRGGTAPNVVRAEFVRGLVDYFEQRFGLPEVRATEARFDDATRRQLAARSLDGHWCSAESLAEALDTFDREFGDGDRSQVAEAGRHFARAHYYSGERVEMFKNITPELFFSMVSDIWNRYFAAGDARVLKVGRGYGRMAVNEQQKPALANSVAMLGVLDEGLRLAGASGVSVRLASSAAVGDDRDLFEATWTG